MLEIPSLEIPSAFRELLTPARYKVYYGGRGSGKSHSVATALVALSVKKPLRIICAREFQNSIADSVISLLADTIRKSALPGFTVLRNEIVHLNGSRFAFKGLRSNIDSIKSFEGADICWVEEAQRVSEDSWKKLIPTIRKEGSEIWITMNPESEDDPTYKRFIATPPPGAIVRKVNFDANPFFTETLRQEMEYAKRVDYESYEHVWLGMVKKVSNAVIFRGKYRVDRFEPPKGVRFFFGADWGFAVDPMALVRCYIDGKKLFIDHEGYEVGVEIDGIAARIARIPGMDRGPIYADSARPETISHVARRGINIHPAPKWKGSVEDGIEFLRSFEEIVIHERCVHMHEEARLYSYKTDKLTGEVLPEVEDRNNHLWDAVRYALSPYIRKKASPLALATGIMGR
jgi:phage terminase large subunit